MTTKNPRFEVYESLAMPGTWFWRLMARNGEIVASGEAFTSRKGANRGVSAVKRAIRAVLLREENAP